MACPFTEMVQVDFLTVFVKAKIRFNREMIFPAKSVGMLSFCFRETYPIHLRLS